VIAACPVPTSAVGKHFWSRTITNKQTKCSGQLYRAYLLMEHIPSPSSPIPFLKLREESANPPSLIYDLIQ